MELEARGTMKQKTDDRCEDAVTSNGSFGIDDLSIL
jgi:hypothetical protein